jgi:hypothetical protein
MKLCIIRLLTGVGLYMTLALSNQLGIVANSIIFLGYRSFLVFTPWFSKCLGDKDLLVTILLAIIGVAISLYSKFEILGALLIAFGFSVGGFLMKNTAATTPRGSGISKVALSLGNMLSGLIIFSLHNNHIEAFISVIVLLTLSVMILLYNPQDKLRINRENKSLAIKDIIKDYKPYLIWLCLGTVIGIRVFGFYVILPYYLQRELGYLPDWYGTAFVVYGVIVILSQLHAMSNKFKVRLEVALVFLLLSILIMSNPNLFTVESFYGAIIWIIILALEEMFAPYLDFHASKQSTLLVKEIGVGLGGILCVVLVRSLDVMFLLPFVSFVLSGIGYYLLKKQFYSH